MLGPDLPGGSGTRDAQNSIVNILQYSLPKIQYIGIVRRSNTIYCYCQMNQYNILILSDKAIQYIDIARLTNTPGQYIVAHRGLQYYSRTILHVSGSITLLTIYCTIHWYCHMRQYNILILSDEAIQYIGIVG